MPEDFFLLLFSCGGSFYSCQIEPLDSCSYETPIEVLSILTKHFLQVCHPQEVWALVVEERDPLFVVWRQAWYLSPFQTAIPVESPHFADPYFLGAVDKTPVYPAGHSIQLKTKIGTT